MLRPETRLNRYRIIRPLGTGGMGEVYEAEDTRLKRPVAIKILPDGISADPARLARFEREAQAVAVHRVVGAVAGRRARVLHEFRHAREHLDDEAVAGALAPPG